MAPGTDVVLWLLLLALIVMLVLCAAHFVRVERAIESLDRFYEEQRRRREWRQTKL